MLEDLDDERVVLEVGLLHQVLNGLLLDEVVEVVTEPPQVLGVVVHVDAPVGRPLHAVGPPVLFGHFGRDRLVPEAPQQHLRFLVHGPVRLKVDELGRVGVGQVVLHV